MLKLIKTTHLNDMKINDIKINDIKINDIILEVPLPSDWDTNKFGKNNTSYKDMINYANERSQQVGVGSSRIAFNVPYQGRKTIIKVAKNSKGIAQHGFIPNLQTRFQINNLINFLDIHLMTC